MPSKRQKKELLAKASTLAQALILKKEDFRASLPDAVYTAEGYSTPTKKRRTKGKAEKATSKGDVPSSTDTNLDQQHSNEKPAPRAPVTEEGAQETKRSATRLRRNKRKTAAGLQEARNTASNIAEASLQQQADWLWASFKEMTGASDLERAGLEEANICRLGDCGSLEERVNDYDGDSLKAAAAADLEQHGSPVIILVAASAVIANLLGKQLPGYTKGCPTAKLFAKHFKVGEQRQALRRTVQVATGTPNRMWKLADLGSLKLGRFKLLILDVALDAKQRTFLDVPEVRNDFWLLFSGHVRQHIACGTAKIALVNSTSVL